MAVVTLKDLMDPLVRIAAATEKTAQKIDAVVAAVTGGAGASLNQELITELRVQTDLLRTIAGNTKGGGVLNVEGKQISKDKLKEGAEAIKMLGGGAGSLAFGLHVFRLVPKNTVKKFTETVKELMESFSEIDPKKVERGALAFEMIAGSIGQFAKGLTLAGLLFAPAMIGAGLIRMSLNILMPTLQMLGDSEKNIGQGVKVLDLIGGSLIKFSKGLVLVAVGSAIGILFTPLIVLSMLTLGGAFSLLGKFDKFIKPGGETLGIMGRSLLMFSAGLVTFALATSFILIKPKILLAMVGTLVLLGGAMATIGILYNPIKKGAIALTLIGGSLAIFSVGYLIFNLVSKNIEPSDVGIQSLLLFSLGAVTALAGLAFKFIALGSLSFIAMGAGLAIFSIGYLPFALVTKDMTMENIGVQLSLLLGLGLEFAAAGFGAVAIIPGALAFAAIGGSLWALSKGLNAFKSINFTEDDASALTLTLSGIKTAFLGTDTAKETGVKGFFSKIGGAITGAVDSVRMVEAAAGFVAAGFSLKALSQGLAAFKSIKWNDNLSKELVTILNGVTTAFALAGGTEQVASSSFFGQMFGFKRTAVEEGINSVLNASKALKNIAKGLQSFQSLVDSGINFGQPDSSGRYEKGTLGYAVTNSIGFINEAFASVAEQGNVESGGFFGSLLGIRKNKVAEGISSVKGAGNALIGITKGLTDFQNLINKEVSFGEPDSEGRYEKNTLGYAITNTIGFINEAFAAVADQGNVQAGGFFGSLFKIKKNKVAEGINSVKGAGSELTNIATGLKTFQELIDKEISWTKLSESVKLSLGFVGDAFASIGEQTQTKNIGIFGLGISWDQNKVNKGISSVQGAGAELTNIANGLKTFQEMVESKVNFTNLGNVIKNSLTIIGDAFAIVGGKEETDNAFFGLIKWDENLVQKGIENVKGAGTELTNIAKGLQTFSNLKDPTSIADSIKKIFTSIGDTFTFYYEKPKFRGQLDHMKSFISSISFNAKKGYLHKAADGMSKMAAAVNSIDSTKAEAFANLFKGAGELTNNQAAFEALLDAVEDIREALAAGGGTPPAGGGGGGTPPPNQAGLQPTLNNINDALGRLNGTMSQLPAAIQSIKIIVPE